MNSLNYWGTGVFNTTSTQHLNIATDLLGCADIHNPHWDGSRAKLGTQRPALASHALLTQLLWDINRLEDTVFWLLLGTLATPAALFQPATSQIIAYIFSTTIPFQSILTHAILLFQV